MGGFLAGEFFGNTVFAYLTAAITFIAGAIVILIVKKVLLKKLCRIVEKTDTELDDFVVKSIRSRLIPLGYVVVAMLSLKTLVLPGYLAKVVDVTGYILLTLLGVRFAMGLITFAIDLFWLRHEKNGGRKHIIGLMLRIARGIIWAVAVILLLDNMGVKVTPIIAGLGIGGVAVALAGQTILADLFSCFAIFFDRPFEIGDFIAVGEFVGVVDYIGLKTTQLKSLSGEQVVISNHDLTNSRVRNYKRMEKRRVVFHLGLTYQTSRDQLVEAIRLITDIVKGIEGSIFDRAHFFSYGDFNLILEVVYHVVGNDYNKYMDIQQAINLRIKEEFEKRGIEFAYPTQTLFIEKPGSASP